MSLKTQVAVFIERADALIPSLPAAQAQGLRQHRDAVLVALNNDAPVGSLPGALGPLRNDAEDCQDWQIGQASGSTWANTQFYFWCQDWEYQLTQALRAAADYLRSINQPGEAEVADAVGDSAQTSGEQADIVVPDDLGTWWDNTPLWVKWAVPAVVVVYLYGSLQVGKAAVRS